MIVLTSPQSVQSDARRRRVPCGPRVHQARRTRPAVAGMLTTYLLLHLRSFSHSTGSLYFTDLLTRLTQAVRLLGNLSVQGAEGGRELKQLAKRKTIDAIGQARSAPYFACTYLHVLDLHVHVLDLLTLHVLAYFAYVLDLRTYTHKGQAGSTPARPPRRPTPNPNLRVINA